MKVAVSNIALTPFDHVVELSNLTQFGIVGLEVAPSRVWHDTWHGLTSRMVTDYRRAIERAGLRAVGLHSLFWDHRELGLFRDIETRGRTLDFLVHLSRVCRDLGGRTLIYGSAWARARNGLSMASAVDEAVRFFSELCRQIEGHGTCVCFEPVGPDESDFVNSIFESIAIAEKVGHPSFQVQIDAKALVANHEANFESFRRAAPMLVHFHANDPGLGILGETGAVNHSALGEYLRRVGYNGYVSIEQRMIDGSDPLGAVARSTKVATTAYGGSLTTSAAIR